MSAFPQPTVVALSILMLVGTPAIGQQSSEKPTFLPDGTVRVPAFELPPSEYSSPEAREALKLRARGRIELSDAGLSIEQARANIERYVAPDLADVRQRYSVEITPRDIAGVKTRVIVPKRGEANPHRVLINLHGGAFNRCADGCALIESIPVAALGRFKVISIDYREAPEYVFPAASEDVAAVYQELLRTYRPEDIGIYGCSAGGALTAQAAAWIIDKGLPVPGALGMFSAGAVRHGAGDSTTITAFIDGSLPAPGAAAAAAPAGPLPRSYFEGANVKSALISPADYPDVIARFPPTLLITGTRAFEMSPVLYTHSQLLKAGVASHLLVGEGMEHCYIYHTNMPEARDAIDVVVRFFDDNLGRRAALKAEPKKIVAK